MLLSSMATHAARTVLVYGDSLSAGYGIRKEASWPALLQQRIEEKRLDYSVANASISGETTAGGRSRMAEAITRHRPAVVVIALGANDGLRGLPVAAMKENLAAMIAASHKGGAKVVLVGMMLPPNYGSYANDFRDAFADVAKREKVTLVPFLLDGVAANPRLFQPDTIHPTAEAQPALLDNVWKGLAPLLK